MEQNYLQLEFKELDTGSRTAVIAHSIYNSIDLNGDIATKGMFSKSWKENKGIDFLFNHKEDQILGTVTGTHEDEEKAYTSTKFGKWKLADDVMEMAEAKVLRGASFGFYTDKKEMIEVKGRKIRKLKEVRHAETSLMTKQPAHPGAGIVMMKKQLEQKQLTSDEKSALMAIVTNDQATLEKLIQLSGAIGITDDLYSWISWNISRRADMMGDIRSQLRYSASQAGELKQHLKTMESFVRNAKASDECIQSVINEISETKSILSEYDTALTDLINQPGSSRNDNDSFRKKLLLLTSNL